MKPKFVKRANMWVVTTVTPSADKSGKRTTKQVQTWFTSEEEAEAFINERTGL